MSDFLTNLVIRSFSRTPSFQPMMAPSAAAEAEQEPPPLEPPVTSAKPQVQHTGKTDEVELNEPITVITPESPKAFDSPKPDLTQKSVVPELEPRTPQITVNTPEIRPPDIKPVRTPQQPITRTRKSEPPIVEQVIEQITEHVTERPAVTVINKQQITKRDITRQALTKQSITNQQITNQRVTNQQTTNQHINNEQITNQDITNQEINNSFTTLVPKPTAQPLPYVTNKTRANRPAVKPPVEPEPAALPPETVINVAIGRIEVRATPASAPQKERRPAPKVMTLDDYVQQRSRGAK